ncbi:MAG: hypothetical protein V3R99_01010 [Thermoguttaceae bacterium]
MSLEQNEPRSVKVPAPGRRRRIVIWVVALLALPLVAVVLGWYGCLREQNGSKPPAPDAPEAQQWKPKEPKEPKEEPSQAEAPDDVPTRDWNLPLEIVIDDIPEIPEEIKGPSPPIEEESEAEDPSSTQKR